MALIDRLRSRQARICVVGLGYVGLPLAVVFAEAGFRVTGIDLDDSRVQSINRGESYMDDVPSETLLRLAVDSPALSATTDYDALLEADAAIVCVPTPLSKTKDPDLSYIVGAIDEIARRLHRDMLVVLESTTYPGTTEEVVLPALQEKNGQGLAAGTDFFLAFSPERVDPGQTQWTIVNTPKVIGGVTAQCTEAAVALYQCAVDEVVAVSSPKTAEMVKLLENTFRAANIGLANEIAIICDRLDVNVWEVIDAAKTKPFGFMPFYPGPGLGGHCIPVDPQYLAWKMRTLDYTARFIQVADEVNLSMPFYWVTKVQDALNEAGSPVKGASVLILGVTYKRDVADIRESPALDIIEALLSKGARVSYHDPYASNIETDTYELSSVPEGELYESVATADCVVIVTDHSSYDWARIGQKARLTVDTRNALPRARVESPASSLLTGQPGVVRE